MRPLDTTPYAEEIQIEVFRRMGPEKRLQAAVSLAQTSRKLLKEGVRGRHPEYSEDQVRLAVIRLMLGEDLFLSAYAEAKDTLP
ncbi:MAG: hypothetical protein JSV01_03325 [Desulfobacterales bacterium]|nr:MAG: hypothetical protein JSV01_03325 [Desulfobacterales bacterium]